MNINYNESANNADEVKESKVLPVDSFVFNEAMWILNGHKDHRNEKKKSEIDEMKSSENEAMRILNKAIDLQKKEGQLLNASNFRIELSWDWNKKGLVEELWDILYEIHTDLDDFWRDARHEEYNQKQAKKESQENQKQIEKARKIEQRLNEIEPYIDLLLERQWRLQDQQRNEQNNRERQERNDNYRNIDNLNNMKNDMESWLTDISNVRQSIQHIQELENQLITPSDYRWILEENIKKLDGYEEYIKRYINVLWDLDVDSAAQINRACEENNLEVQTMLSNLAYIQKDVSTELRLQNAEQSANRANEQIAERDRREAEVRNNRGRNRLTARR